MLVRHRMVAVAIVLAGTCEPAAHSHTQINSHAPRSSPARMLWLRRPAGRLARNQCRPPTIRCSLRSLAGRMARSAWWRGRARSPVRSTGCTCPHPDRTGSTLSQSTGSRPIRLLSHWCSPARIASTGSPLCTASSLGGTAGGRCVQAGQGGTVLG